MKEKFCTPIEHIVDYAFVSESLPLLLVIWTTLMGSLVAYAIHLRGLP